MTGVLVCMPTRRSGEGLVGEGPLLGFCANEALRLSLGYGPDMDEEAEYGALVIASVAGLSRFGERFVVTAEVAPAQLGQGEEAENGGVRVSGLRADQMLAFFTDPEEDPSAAAARARGLGVDEAWELAEVQDLLAHELQWHDIAEWDLP